MASKGGSRPLVSALTRRYYPLLWPSTARTFSASIHAPPLGQALLPSQQRPLRAPTWAPSSSSCCRRFAHRIPRQPPTRHLPDAEADEPVLAPTSLAPYYELTFTCVPCGTRSAHKISKQGYHNGSVLITCPECRNRHVISDHLGIFGTLSSTGGPSYKTVDELVRARGDIVKKGALGEDGDVEFWEDGTTTLRAERQAAESVRAYEKINEPDGGKPEADAAPGSTFRSTARLEVDREKGA